MTAGFDSARTAQLCRRLLLAAAVIIPAALAGMAMAPTATTLAATTTPIPGDGPARP